MRLNLDFILRDLEGNAIEGMMSQVHAGMLLGNIIAGSSKSTDILKWMGWAQRLYNKEEIDISEHEKNEIKRFIESTDSLTILAKYQLINAIGHE